MTMRLYEIVQYRNQEYMGDNCIRFFVEVSKLNVISQMTNIHVRTSNISCKQQGIWEQEKQEPRRRFKQATRKRKKALVPVGAHVRSPNKIYPHWYFRLGTLTKKIMVPAALPNLI
ncbi:hypothetical protein ACJX0J_041096, partial [Zea mays]